MEPMKTIPFSITAEHFTWIDGTSNDDPEDLCSHGDVTIHLGDKTLSYGCCTSAAAMRMLRTLTEDHIPQDPMNGEQMLPCCGFNLYADADLQNVYISGCPYGVDYEVRHQGELVVIITEDGTEYIVLQADYHREVLKFVHQVEEFYQNSLPKVLPDDEIDRNGYIAFWNEWKRRLNEWQET